MHTATILMIHMNRHATNGINAQGGYTYTVTKMTPFGELYAVHEVAYNSLVDKGLNVVDGEAFDILMKDVNRQENAFLFSGINNQFGSAENLREGARDNPSDKKTSTNLKTVSVAP